MNKQEFFLDNKTYKITIEKTKYSDEFEECKIKAYTKSKDDFGTEFYCAISKEKAFDLLERLLLEYNLIPKGDTSVRLF